MHRFAVKNTFMKFRETLCILCAALASAVPGYGIDDFHFSTIPSAAGFSQNCVTAIEEDEHGCLWMGTDDGVNRYDGYDITVFRHDPKDVHTIQSNIINRVYKDSRSRLWICSANGLSTYDNDMDRFDRFSLPGIHSVEDIVEISEDTFLITTRNASYILDSPSGEIREFQLDGRPLRFYASILDGDNIILCTMSRNMETLIWSKGKGLARKYRPVQLPDFGRAILASGDDTYIIGTNGSGALTVNAKTGECRPCFEESGKFVNALAYDGNGCILAGSTTGLMAYRDGTFISQSSSSTIEQLVRVIYRDSRDGIWVGTEYGGVRYWNSRKDRFHPVVFRDAPNVLEDDIATTIGSSPDGNIWIGTRYGGLNRYDKESRMRTSYSLDNIRCLHFMDDGKTMLAGAEVYGLYILDIETGRIIAHHTRPSDITAIVDADDGDLWVGSLVGLFRYSSSDGTLKRIQLPSAEPITRILTLFKDTDGSLWVGCKESLKVYKAAGERMEDITPACLKDLIQVRCIRRNTDSTIWLGTSDGMIEYTRPRTGEAYMSGVPGLQTMTIRGIEADNEGTLWISTDNSLYRYTPNERTFRVYTSGDGFRCGFNTYAHCRGNDGTLYFGGIGGVTEFRPEEMTMNDKTVRPMLSGLMLNNQEVRPGDASGILAKSLSSVKRIKLKHYQNSITLRFTCPDFISGQSNRFKYKMDGVDKDWITARNREATYANLDKGHYRFRLTASNSDGIWSPEETTLEIRVRPIWYRTMLARGLSGLTVLALLLLGISRLIRHINIKNELRMAEMTKRYENQIRRARIDRFVAPSYQLRPQDEEFLTHILDSIGTNACDPDFSVERLASDACMSRNNLHLKIKAITGKTPVELIRAIRMEKACDLLKEGKLSIAEIAEHTGFQTSSYFITAFKKSFGITPGRYASMMK